MHLRAVALACVTSACIGGCIVAGVLLLENKEPPQGSRTDQPDDPLAPEAQPDRAAALRAAEIQLGAQWEDALARESVDAKWSQSMEHRLLALKAQEMFRKVELKEVDCRSQTCRFTVGMREDVDGTVRPFVMPILIEIRDLFEQTSFLISEDKRSGVVYATTGPHPSERGL